jgi:hypothetical protein
MEEEYSTENLIAATNALLEVGNITVIHCTLDKYPNKLKQEKTK